MANDVGTDPVRAGGTHWRGAPSSVAGAFLERVVVPPSELREQLLSFISHEIRNPLASALWSVEMLARKPGTDARAERLSNLALRSTRRLRSLLEDFFALERVPASPPPGRTDLLAALERARSAHDLEPDGLELGLEGPEGLVVPLDPTVLDRLLHSCLRRAVHAGEGGEVQVTVEPVGDEAVQVRIVRRDTPVEVLDPPLLSPGGSEGGGTTFTLYVARVAAQRLGVALHSYAQGPDAVLHLVLPRAAADDAPNDEA